MACAKSGKIFQSATFRDGTSGTALTYTPVSVQKCTQAHGLYEIQEVKEDGSVVAVYEKGDLMSTITLEVLRTSMGNGASIDITDIALRRGVFASTWVTTGPTCADAVKTFDLITVWSDGTTTRTDTWTNCWVESFEDGAEKAENNLIIDTFVIKSLDPVPASVNT